MALPKIDAPVYELDLPLSKKHIKYRPFLVKEQRNLMMAMEADDSDTIQQNIKQVLNNCTLTPGIDIEKLPIIDVEYYFLQLRARSVGEIANNKYKCNNLVDGKECGTIMDVPINILEIKLDESQLVSNEIKLTDSIVVKLKYPEFSVVKRMAGAENITDFAFNMIAESIESIFDGEQYHYASDASPEELMEFIESLNQEQFSKLEEFFNHLPKLKKTIEFTCKKCGFQHTIEAEGLESFFA